MTCEDCAKKAARPAAITELAQLWIAAGKLRGFVEGAEWALKCMDHLAPQLAGNWRARLRTSTLEKAIRDFAPAIRAKLAPRAEEALRAEHAARTRTHELERELASKPTLRTRLARAAAALRG